jgi:filamentous hemagglutinin family protein
MTTTILKRRLVPLLLSACFGMAVAAPTGQQVMAGQATFSQQGNVFSITNTPGTIINWQSFSINAGEITRFIQQGSDSAVLNRIVGQDPTRILGALQSNGQVFLINPNGILFGRDSRVDVNGLVASTLNLSNADFLAGKKNFTAGAVAGDVRNEGAITTPTGGQVFLVAPNVTNAGIITSPKGDVVLAAGHSVQLVDSRDPDMQVVVSAPADQAINLGQVVAQGGRIGIYGALVNQRGVVNANSAVIGENGKIVLKASRDTVLEQGSVTSATGAGKGGDVHLLGERVSLAGNAQVDASGAMQGGSVLVGGDWQGKNAALPNARETFMDKDASIKADATAGGDGGKVVLWSDVSTRAFGSISAQGGQAGGNGGTIETSGHKLAVDGIRIDARAAKGKSGTWLLDPYDIEVKADGLAGVVDVATSGAGEATGVTKIAPSVLASAGAEVVLQAQHDITITDAISATNNVTATAGNDIYVNANVTAAGVSNDDPTKSTGTIRFNATNDIKVSANVTSTSSYIQFNAGRKFDLGSGAVVKGDKDIDVIADQVSLGGTITRLTAGSNLMVGFTTRTAALPIQIGGSSEGLLLWLDPSQLANISAGGVNIGTSGSTGGISIQGEVNQTGSFSLNSSGPININAAVKVGPSSSFMATLWGDQGTLLDVNAAITAGNDVYLKGDGLRISAPITGNNVTLMPHTPGTAISLGALHEGDFSLDQDMLSKVHASSLTIGGGLGHAAGILVSDTLDLSANPFGLLTLNAGQGDISVNGILTMPSGVLALKSEAGITEGAGGGLKVDQLAVKGGDVALGNGDNNQIGTIAGAGTGAVFQVASIGPLTVGQAGGLSGVSASSGDVQVVTTGKLTVANDIDAGGNIAIIEANGIGGNGKIKAGVLSLTSYAGIGSTTAALNTQTGVLNVHNDQAGAAPINISNTGDLAIGAAVQSGEVAADNTGAITITTTGNMVVPATTSTETLAGSDSVVQTSSGAITLKAGASMNIGGSVTSDSGNISLAAGSGMAIGGTLTSTSGNIDLLADKGSAFTTQSGAAVHSDSGNINVVAGTGSIATGTITTGSTGKVTLNIGSKKPDPGPPPPSLDQCVKNPNSAACGGVIEDAKKACSANWHSGHCDDVMPKIDFCKANPTAPSCAAVIKHDAVLQCAANPRGANCGDVLPKFDECQANSGDLVCDAVIKQHDQVSACMTNPTAACYSDVLPTFDTCAKNAATFGCTPVVKRHDDISACIADPKAAGCSAVLPGRDTCHANAGEFGCAPVLAREKFEGCVANASGPGCDAVLPALDVCKATPAAEGCGAVIKKTFDQCLVNPNEPRCTGVLPKVSECVADKTQPGCQVVLPTMNQCIGSPTLQGCAVVLPKIEQCAVNPSQTGCEAVLPKPDFCGTHPTDPTCAVFNPAPGNGKNDAKGGQVTQAVQTSVTLINGSTGKTGGAGGSGANSGLGNPAGTGTNSGTSGSDSNSDKPADKVSGPAAGENSGARNEKPATKTYCN